MLDSLANYRDLRLRARQVSPAGFFLFVLAFVLVVYGVAAYLLETPFGRLLVAVRANEQRVESE